MKQLFIIHGGTSFDSYDSYVANLKSSDIEYERLKKEPRWTSWLADELSGVDVLYPSFPNTSNAQYDEWKIYFEKLQKHFGDEVTLVGYSLGGMFLSKYLAEKSLVRKVKKILLVAPGYDDDTNEELGSFRVTSASQVADNADEVHLFHSKDDFVAPFAEMAKYQRDIPTAIPHVFEDRNHFFQPTFPELLEIIKK